MLMSSLDTSIANAALPAISRAFDASFQSVRWVVLGYLLALTVFTVSAGRLGDRIGRRRLLLAATVMFMISSVACSLAPTLQVLLTARVMQGIAAAAMTALALALVHDVVPASATGRAIGLLGTMSAFGTTVGPSLGGLLTEQFGWNAIFLVNVPIGAAALLMGLLRLPLEPSAEDRRPLLDTALLRTGTVVTALTANTLVSTVMMTTLVVGPFYLSRALGLSDGAMGLALSLGPLVAALTGVPAGRLIDRFGAERMTMAGLMGLGIAASGAGMLPRTAGTAGYLLAIVGMTASYAVFQTANNTQLMNRIDPRARGSAAGLLGFTRNLGLIGGVSAMGAVFAWAAGPTNVVGTPPDVIADAALITFRVAALLIGVAIAVVVPGLLILLAVVPVVAGVVRLAQPSTDPALVLHLLSVIPYSLLGAMQFSPTLRRHWPGWHRKVGRILVGLGLLSALTGLWMAHFYPWRPLDGLVVYLERLVFGTAMLAALVAGIGAVRRRDFGAHGRWMIRAYAIGMGAGTQVLTHLPWLAFAGELTETTRAIAMGAGWVINVVVAEFVILRNPLRPQPVPQPDSGPTGRDTPATRTRAA